MVLHDPPEIGTVNNSKRRRGIRFSRRELRLAPDGAVDVVNIAENDTDNFL